MDFADRLDMMDDDCDIEGFSLEENFKQERKINMQELNYRGKKFTNPVDMANYILECDKQDKYIAERERQEKLKAEKKTRTEEIQNDHKKLLEKIKKYNSDYKEGFVFSSSYNDDINNIFSTLIREGW